MTSSFFSETKLTFVLVAILVNLSSSISLLTLLANLLPLNSGTSLGAWLSTKVFFFCLSS